MMLPAGRFPLGQRSSNEQKEVQTLSCIPGGRHSLNVYRASCLTLASGRWHTGRPGLSGEENPGPLRTGPPQSSHASRRLRWI